MKYTFLCTFLNLVRNTAKLAVYPISSTFYQVITVLAQKKQQFVQHVTYQ